MTGSPPAPLPVQQRAWDTRERILEAAVVCLAEDGYAATTTSRIQERAKVSRGSLLHQFPSRDHLLIAAVQHLAEQRTGEWSEDSAPASDIDDAVGRVWETFNGPLFRAAVQLWIAAEHNPDLAAALRPRERELGRRIRLTIARLFGETHASHPRFGDFVTLLLSSMRGTALTYTFEPREHDAEPALAAWHILAHQILEGIPDTTTK